MNWRKARDLLDGKGKKRGPRDSLKIARNTYLERGLEFRAQGRSGLYNRTAMGHKDEYPADAIGLRLHGTYVAILTPRWTELYTGGWHTMTTRDRIGYVANVHADRGGWYVAPINNKLPCYCSRERDDVNDGIVIVGSPSVGMELRWTEKYELPCGTVSAERGEFGKPIYKWAPCLSCEGTGLRRGPDWDNGHPFYDGIRISADGTKLMRTQPHKRKEFTPVRTESGW